MTGPQPIVFFDGYCGLCNGFVDFLIARDVSNRLRFAPIQGVTAATLIPEDAVADGNRNENPDGVSPAPRSIVLCKNGRILRKSDAVLGVLCGLGGVWKSVRILNLVPRSVRDFVYDGVAANRYRWFGRRTTCRAPAGREWERFLP
jgi:predicted DCC family thiol-disulfide oxidoreductase YuxK